MLKLLENQFRTQIIHFDSLKYKTHTNTSDTTQKQEIKQTTKNKNKSKKSKRYLKTLILLKCTQ